MADLQYVLKYVVILAGAFVSLRDFSLAQTCSGHSDCPGVGGCCCTHDTPFYEDISARRRRTVAVPMIEQCSRDVSEPGARRWRRDIHALNTCINEARPHSNPAGEIPGACECKEGYKAAAPSGVRQLCRDGPGRGGTRSWRRGPLRGGDRPLPHYERERSMVR